MSLIKPVALIKRTSADRGTFTTGLATQIQGPASGDSAWSDESVGTPITPVPALPLAGTHVIPAGDKTAQMGFALIEDTVNEADETVKVRLSNARVVDAYGDKIKDLDITTAEATGTITAPLTSTTNVPGLTIRIQDATGDEDDGWIDFRVRLSRKYDDYVCYDFETISGGTATEGRDYIKRPKVGQWMQIGKRVDKPFVRIIDDSVNDDGETVKVKISNLRRARSFATMALGTWAYPIDSDVPETIKKNIARLHRRGQQLAGVLQTLYYDAVELACIQASIQPHQ